MFQEGIVEHGMMDRAIEKGKPLEEIFADELQEMDEFLKEMPNIEDPAFRDIIQGAGMLARGTYLLVKPEQVRNGSYRIPLKRVTDVFYGMETKFYSELEKEPERMKKLVAWMNDYIRDHLKP